MRFEVLNPVWRTNVAEALAEAALLRRAVVVKPLGQGVGAKDDW